MEWNMYYFWQFVLNLQAKRYVFVYRLVHRCMVSPRVACLRKMLYPEINQLKFEPMLSEKSHVSFLYKVSRNGGWSITMTSPRLALTWFWSRVRENKTCSSYFCWRRLRTLKIWAFLQAVIIWGSKNASSAPALFNGHIKDGVPRTVSWISGKLSKGRTGVLSYRWPLSTSSDIRTSYHMFKIKETERTFLFAVSFFYKHFEHNLYYTLGQSGFFAIITLPTLLWFNLYTTPL